MRIHLLSIMAMLLACLSSCGGRKQDTSTAGEKKPLEFVLPEVPVMLQSAEDRLDFVVRHYWNKFDFKDTAYIHVPDITEQAMANYMDLLSRVPQAIADTCLNHTLQTASQEPKMLNYFVEIFRKYWFDPNSPIRSEELFEPVCRFLVHAPVADDAARSRAQYDLKLIALNRKGSVANDFFYTLPSGVQRRMHGISSSYTLILFYNPDCHGCAETLAYMKASKVLNDPFIAGQVKILAFYPDEEHEVWEKYQTEIPSAWINSYDKELTVLNKELYDLKAMPTLYLLDKDKKVLLKDAPVAEVEQYLAGI